MQTRTTKPLPLIRNSPRQPGLAGTLASIPFHVTPPLSKAKFDSDSSSSSLTRPSLFCRFLGRPQRPPLFSRAQKVWHQSRLTQSHGDTWIASYRWETCSYSNDNKCFTRVEQSPSHQHSDWLIPVLISPFGWLLHLGASAAWLQRTEFLLTASHFTGTQRSLPRESPC